MGIYLNPNNENFQRVIETGRYIDKTMLTYAIYRVHMVLVITAIIAVVGDEGGSVIPVRGDIQIRAIPRKNMHPVYCLTYRKSVVKLVENIWQGIVGQLGPLLHDG